ncbi:MAG: DUF4296 domain-containing protein [Flavobacteriales bacterium]|nr:DUF4296 domain-containing protein [Flavobacteriales bacterium]MDG1780869.1 DUF4296 domain-containing protein [Flavobacteriales bacterium]MDG2246706.1 DUF4296 domain-containing protein [Flavobacteriales bacterium]
MKWLIPLIFLVLVACGEEQPEQPPGALDRAKFVQVLADIELIEGISKHKIIRNDDPETRIKGYYRDVFEKHQVSDSAFKITYDWYYSQPAEMLIIYDEVLMELKMKEEGYKPEAEG